MKNPSHYAHQTEKKGKAFIIGQKIKARDADAVAKGLIRKLLRGGMRWLVRSTRRPGVKRGGKMQNGIFKKNLSGGRIKTPFVLKAMTVARGRN